MKFTIDEKDELIFAISLEIYDLEKSIKSKYASEEDKEKSKNEAEKLRMLLRKLCAWINKDLLK